MRALQFLGALTVVSTRLLPACPLAENSTVALHASTFLGERMPGLRILPAAQHILGLAIRDPAGFKHIIFALLAFPKMETSAAPALLDQIPTKTRAAVPIAKVTPSIHWWATNIKLN
jgi:hypothetical protein